MRRIVIDAQDTIELNIDYTMIINNEDHRESFNTNIPSGCVALARIYRYDAETGDTIGDPLDEFLIIGKGEADNPK